MFPFKPESMYNMSFCETMQNTAVASQRVIRMFMQMLLKEESRTFPIFKIKTVHVSDSDIK
jgi:hypothetical protein